MILFTFLHHLATPDHLGLIPQFLAEEDERDACEQINDRYSFGGGWFDLRVGKAGFSLDSTGSLKYPGDPRMPPLAEGILHPLGKAERILVYESGFVAVVQADGAFRVSRLD